jgi:hypothetical protein
MIWQLIPYRLIGPLQRLRVGTRMKALNLKNLFPTLKSKRMPQKKLRTLLTILKTALMKLSNVDVIVLLKFIIRSKKV